MATQNSILVSHSGPGGYSSGLSDLYADLSQSFATKEWSLAICTRFPEGVQPVILKFRSGDRRQVLETLIKSAEMQLAKEVLES